MDRPIIFSGQMVQALLSGRKTQTRRLASSPFGKCEPGDRLWVRESWQGEVGDLMPIYAATDERTEAGWRPSIHMPRWASRLTLVVTEVRRQRLQEISEADAVAEGCINVAMTLTGEDNGSAIWGPYGFAALWDSLHGGKPGEAWTDNPEIIALTFTVHRCNIDSMAQVETA